MSNCESFFGIGEHVFIEKNCINTASEIANQPTIWKELGEILLAKKQEISAFMQSLGNLKDLRIILTGAGSSAFIGETLSCFAAKHLKIKCESIHTTDIVSAPDTVLFADIPTLIISFARSGNSPESTGAIQYARKIIKNLHEVAIVCDDKSRLYDITAESKNGFVLVMPEGSNDKGFAMTSSVTCMMLAGFALLNYGNIDEIVNHISRLSESVAADSRKLSEEAMKYAAIGFDRAIYLGSGSYKGLAHEGSLKMMELSSGAVNTNFDTSTGFRHGPKSVINNKTLSLHFISQDPFTARYDLDLLKEMYAEKEGNTIIAVCGGDTTPDEADGVVSVACGGYDFAHDLYTGIKGLVFFQMLAMHKSIGLGITTDNPSPGGQLNRVVKGVTIYDL